jgi:starch synthase
VDLKLLFAASELFPVAKVGGLGDATHGLALALRALGADVQVAIPGYRGAPDGLTGGRRVADITVHGSTFSVLSGQYSGERLPVLVFECPALFNRPGDPYHDPAGRPWPDNVTRFALFSEALARFAAANPDFRIVHAHDWHVGLVMPWLRELKAPAARVFTIHNLSHPGLFDPVTARTLDLPAAWWHRDGIEFHEQGSCLKAGIAYADTITTVSPTYAREIQQPAQGCGLDGLLRQHAARLHGICNGIDGRTWDPATDRAIAQRFGVSGVARAKALNKSALQRELGLAEDPHALLVGMVTRLAEQKGVDLVLHAAAELTEMPLQFAILGKGDPQLEAGFRDWATREPARVAVQISHNEGLAHRIFAGADAFLMPSRFEPCGLTQMYSQHYGTIPIARRTGGLADTIADATPDALAAGIATGVLFESADTESVLQGLRRALELRSRPDTWQAMREAGMRRDFSWHTAAGQYRHLYRTLTA